MKTKMDSDRKHICLRAACSFLIFIAIWTFYVIVKRMVEIGDLVEGFLSIGDLFWMGSGALLIWLNRKHLHVKPKELFTTIPKPRILLPMLAIIVIYYTASMFLTHGSFHIDQEAHIPGLIIMFLIVGFQEELLFRGYFLNHLAAAMTERRANLWSALLFLLIHFPGWILRGYTASMLLSLSIGVYLLGIVFGWAFRKSRSLWTSVILHMVWDVFSTIIF